VILSDITKPNQGYDTEIVRMLLAIAWFLFIFDMGIATFFRVLFVFINNDILKNGFESEASNNVKWTGSIASGLLQLVGIGAFICLSLVVVAYVEVVRWIAVVSTSLYGLIAMLLVIHQSLAGKIDRYFFDPCVPKWFEGVEDPARKRLVADQRG
jgi:hypothetical protein